VGLAFRHFEETRSFAVEWLTAYLELLPAVAIARVGRAALSCPRLSLEAGAVTRTIVDRYLRRSGNHSPEALRELAEDPQPRVARLVVELLPELDPATAAEVLQAALRNPSASVRYDAVRRAQCLPIRQRIECLPRALVDSAASVRRLAAQQLGECCMPRAMRPLMEAVAAQRFRTRDLNEQVAFFRALAVSGRPEALYTVEQRIIPPPRPLLRQLLDRMSRTPEDPVRQEVIRSLARVGSSQALDILKRGARCSDPGVARSCKAALRDAREPSREAVAGAPAETRAPGPGAVS